jgi:hypothetical protein
MPIEIRELVIKATVTPTEDTGKLTTPALAQLRKELVAECLDRVLEQLALTGSR